MSKFAALDYAIVAVVLACSAAVGLYYRFTGGKQKTANEYMLADRSMSVLPVAFSLMTTYMSAVTLLGVSAEIYQYGTMFLIVDLGYALATPIAVLFILPVFYRQKAASVYAYLEQRFGYSMRICASFVYSVQMMLYMGVALIAPALSLEAVTGLSRDFSILSIGLICTFYATLGGLKAVLITDIFQSLLMFVSVFSIIICAAIKANGLTDIWHAASIENRVNFSNISIDPTVRHTWWTQLCGGAVLYLGSYGVNQAQVQRLLSARDLETAQLALWWCTPIVLLLSFSTGFAGLSMFYYYKDCDPVLQGRISSRDQLMPLFVIDTMSHIPGLAGLFVAGIFSAGLSTISAAISSLATVSLEDYVRPLAARCFQQQLSEKQATICLKLFNILFGIICMAMAYLASILGSLLQAALTIFSIFGGPLLGVFMCGLCTTISNQKGVITGLAAGLSISMWMGFGQSKPKVPTLSMSTEQCNQTQETYYNGSSTVIITDAEYFYLYRISYMWYPVIGFLVTLLIGILCSCIYKLLGWEQNAQLYQDAARTIVKHELLIEPLGKRYKSKLTKWASASTIEQTAL